MEGKLTGRAKTRLIIGVLVFFAIYAAFGYIYMNRTARNEWAYFNASNIHGKVVNVSLYHHFSSFETDNNTRAFVFDPINGIKGDDFQYFVQIGDSIKKRAYGDTLFVIRKGKSYRFFFEKEF